MRILVDMDNVIADFDKKILETFNLRYPDEESITLEQRTHFYIEEDFPEDIRPLIRRIYLEKEFYWTLDPVKGSLEALSELSSYGTEVYICTSPLLSNPFCAQEKYLWIMEKLGKEWAKRTIVSKDKTLIQGDILIDDKPEIKGVQEPSWEHILYSQPYNKNIDKKRLTWDNWKSVINSFK